MKKIYLVAFIFSTIFIFSSHAHAATTYTLKVHNLKLNAGFQGSGHLTIPGFKTVETALDCSVGNECSVKAPKGSYFDIKLIPDKDSVTIWNTGGDCDNSPLFGDPLCNIVDMNDNISLTYSFWKIPNGECGSSNAGSFNIKPSTNLCAVGTATSVTGNGPWDWQCVGGTVPGTNTKGSTSSCVAFPATSDGLCGTATTGLYSSAPTSPLDLCAIGTPTTVTGSGPWNWQCKGQAGGKDVSCSARSTVNNNVVNGDCGSSNAGLFNSVPNTNLCATGTATTVTGSGPWDWQCKGQNGGTDSSCVAFYSANSSNGTNSNTSTNNSSSSGAGIDKLMRSISRVILNPLILFLFALALAFFLYGVMQFILNGDNEEKRKSGKAHILWGIIGMVIMVSVFGIMQLILNTLGEKHIKIDNNGNYEVNQMSL